MKTKNVLASLLLTASVSLIPLQASQAWGNGGNMPWNWGNGNNGGNGWNSNMPWNWNNGSWSNGPAWGGNMMPWGGNNNGPWNNGSWNNGPAWGGNMMPWGGNNNGPWNNGSWNTGNMMPWGNGNAPWNGGYGPNFNGGNYAPPPPQHAAPKSNKPAVAADPKSDPKSNKPAVPAPAAAPTAPK